ncbi:MAG: transglycosylase SLT domain-containing protein [Bdellovibrionota bacterium]
MARGRFRHWIIVALLFSPSVFARVETLPYPRALYHKVEFWKLVYTKYTTRQGILHDSEDLSIIYTDVDLGPFRDQERADVQRMRVRDAIYGILSKRGQNLTSFEKEILSKFPKYASRSRLSQAAENIRFQLGQADRFKAGVINSNKYMRDIERILREEGAPDFIKYLPHVESSFQEKAISKYGAAGLWQIMPATGRQFIRVDYAVDERLDPWSATRAAAKYLLQNYRRLREWPLALTAYNHGAGGVERAMKMLGTSDIAEIAFQYSSRSFGFASRNFYAQFLAAVQVAQDYKKYFGALELAQPDEFEEIRLKKDTRFRDFSKEYTFNLTEFKKLNLGLRPVVFQNKKPIPRGTLVRLPKGSRKSNVAVASIDKNISEKILKSTEPEIKLKVEVPRPEKSKASLADAAIKEKDSAPGKLPTLEDLDHGAKYRIQNLVEGRAWIKVEVNESISQISDWVGVDVAEIRKWNGLGDRGQARLGQKLLIRFEKVTPAQFEQDRREYHAQIREDFFSRYQVKQLIDYSVQDGENLWSICYQKFEVPPWLLEEFNPELSLLDIKKGTKLRIPRLEELPPDVMSSAQDETSSL